ncbi:MAG: SPOR domain-containing protein [Candidatus Omnitrophica bacterium]|nr:SPOR domain-containing protein [Candidatus Omnitrophota bacterium]
MKGRQLHLFGGDNNKKMAHKRQSIILPLDTLILISIVIILLLTLAFSLGVEKGRKIAYATIGKDVKAKTHKKDNLQSELDAIISSVPDEILEQVATQAPQKTVTVVKAVNNVATSNSKKYSIQVASYVKEKPAYAEAKRLKAKGYPVIVSKKGKYMVIYVGNFADKKKARNSMQSLKKRFKDCILRTL